MQTWPPAKPIEGLRIRLCCLSLKDARAMAEIMTPDVSRWLASWPTNPTVEAVTERIGRAVSAMHKRCELPFRIEERERNVTVGYVSVAQSHTDSRVGDLSYWLGTAFHGKGYMSEAARLAVAAAFRYLDLDRIEAGAQLENVSSFTVMKRLGMTPIGERVVWVEIRKRNERCLFYSVDRAAVLLMGPIAPARSYVHSRSGPRRHERQH
jgi:ribosomal-protein-alanine N-acetyltransferase